MLIILAKRDDQTAVWLANRWRAHGAALLTAADLSSSGWSLKLSSPQQSTLCVEGRNVSNHEIDGVLTCISCVQTEDLDHIMPADRYYIASEMTAFLLFWLSSLAVPVLNRPTTGSLAGPNWRPEEWMYLAARLGIAVQPVLRKTPNGAKPLQRKSACEVTVVGGHCVGNSAPLLVRKAQTLAKAAGTGLLSVKFTGADADSALLSVSPWPALASPGVADALLHHLLEKHRC